MGENLKEDHQRRGVKRGVGERWGWVIFSGTVIFIYCHLLKKKEEESLLSPPPKRSIEFQTGNYSHHICKSHLTVQSLLHEERTSK